MIRISTFFPCVLLLLGAQCVGTAGGSAAPDSATSKRAIKVFVLAGQSNAVGYNNISEYSGNTESLGRDLQRISRVMFWPGSNARKEFAGKWIGLRTGVSGISGQEPYNEGCFGPELGFALRMLESTPDTEIAIIKYAEGGTGIARSEDYHDYIPALAGFNDRGINWHPPESGRPAGTLYKDLLENIQLALSALRNAGKDYEISGFLWMQGEHEAGISETMADDYKKLLTLFFSSVRRDLGIPNLPFVVGEINSHTWAFGDLGRKRQAEACQNDHHAALVKTVDLSRNGVGDKAHFDADSMLELGKRFAGAMLSIKPE